MIQFRTDKNSHDAQIVNDYTQWGISKNYTFDRLMTPHKISTQYIKNLKNETATATTP